MEDQTPENPISAPNPVNVPVSENSNQFSPVPPVDQSISQSVNQFVSEPVNQSPVNIPPKPKNIFAPFLITILVILGLGALGFWAYQNYFVSSLGSTKPSAEAATPVATTDPTTNWKTYVDSKYGFSFKYPPSWQLINISPNTYKSTATTGYQLYKTDPNTPCKGGGGGPCGNSANILFSIGDTDSSVKDFDYNFWGKGFPISRTENLTIDNINVVRAFSGNTYPEASIYKLSASSQLYVTSEFFPQNEIQTQYSTDTVNELNQILSTFKFTEPGITDGKKIGYIKSIDSPKLAIDYIEWVEDSTQPNGFKINNPSQESATLNISPTAAITIISNIHELPSNSLSLKEFTDAFNQNGTLKLSPFWIETKDGVVTKITEQYIP